MAVGKKNSLLEDSGGLGDASFTAAVFSVYVLVKGTHVVQTIYPVQKWPAGVDGLHPSVKPALCGARTRAMPPGRMTTSAGGAVNGFGRWAAQALCVILPWIRATFACVRALGRRLEKSSTAASPRASRTLDEASSAGTATSRRRRQRPREWRLLRHGRTKQRRPLPRVRGWTVFHLPSTPDGI